MPTEREMLGDFKVFLAELWAFLLLPQPTPVQNDIADFLQSPPKNPASRVVRIGVEAFRGVGKSWITSAYALWRLRRNPQLKVLVVSASKDRADSFSVFTKRLIEEWAFLHILRPRDDQRTSNLAFDVGPAGPSHSPSVKSAGIFGQITGSRADVIIADDIEVPKNAYTQTQRDRLWEAVKEFDAILTTNREENAVIYLGTPQCEMSLYNELPNRGYLFRIWPSQVPDRKQIEFYGDRLSPMIREMATRAEAGAPVDPKRFDAIDLAERATSYGKSGYALQFMLDTRLDDALKFPLKLRDLVVFNVGLEKAPQIVQYGSGPEQIVPVQILPMVGLSGDRWCRPMMYSKPDEWRTYQGSVMSIDPSGRGKDETGYAILKMCHGNLFVPDAGGMLGGYDRPTLEELARKAKLHHVNEIVVEPNFGDGMFNELFKPVLREIYPCTVTEGPRASIQKERRIIDTLEPIMNSHRLIIDEEVIRRDAEICSDNHKQAYSLFWQMTRITRDRGALAHDDRLDALAQGVRYWIDKLGKDQNEAAEAYKTQLLEQELKSFHKHVLGYAKNIYTGRRWFRTGHDPM